MTTTRRAFIKKSTAAASGLMIVPSPVLGNERRTAPN
ncbi:MAG: hypothetical protein CMI18_00510 [Opitutaceae bacterium]|nr:hypothetical protein [Opitutaceae bacterium]